MGELVAVVEADCMGRGERSGLPWQAVELREAVNKTGVACEEVRPLLMGRHLLAMGMVPGREVGVILREAMEQQIEQGWVTVDEALEWAERKLS